MPMRPALPLDSTYRGRAIPLGGLRYWSWLFAAPDVRDALLGIYALGAEWRAQTAPATDRAVAHLKLAWWREEIARLASGSPAHPVSRYLLALPGAAMIDWSPLAAAIDAADDEVGGVPIETGGAVLPHASALWGGPLALASRLTDPDADVRACTAPLAAGHYLSAALRDYRALARIGRVPFAVDELLAAGIDNADLCAAEAPPALRRYLDTLRVRAAECYRSAGASLAHERRGRHRHLLVLAALGLDRLRPVPEPRPARREPPPAGRRLRDMLLAWKTARGAQR